MSKFLHDDVLDLLVKGVADDGNKLFVCSTYPANYTEASSTYMLAQHDMVVGSGNGDYLVQNGDTNGRKVAVTAQATISVTNSGTAGHVALCKSSGSKVLAVTICTTQALVAGNTVTVPTFDVEVADPV